MSYRGRITLHRGSAARSASESTVGAMSGACPPIFMAGDNAVVTTGSPGKVASADDYYPFGMVMEGRSFNYGQADTRYKFSSKERDVETGFDYFGARYYDGRIGRFFTVDRFASNFPTSSPYSYASNNPIGFIDVNGDSTGTNQLWEEYKKQGSFQEEWEAIFGPAEKDATNTTQKGREEETSPTPSETDEDGGVSQNIKEAAIDFFSLGYLTLNGVVGGYAPGLIGKWYKLSNSANQWTGSKVTQRVASKFVSRLTFVPTAISLYESGSRFRKAWSGSSRGALLASGGDLAMNLIGLHPIGAFGALSYDLTMLGYNLDILPRPWRKQ